METIGILEARRLALARAGLLKPEWTGFPKWAARRTRRARKSAHQVIQRFGYLLKIAKRVATALWSAGELSILGRHNFQRVYDLTERVIPERWRQNAVSEPEAISQLLIHALRGHGWAATGTMAQTWRLSPSMQNYDNVFIYSGLSAE